MSLTQDVVTGAALALLDEVGLDGVSTRRVAERLGVEQPSLYWHFRNKKALLAAMAEAAMAPHTNEPLPRPTDDWAAWFAENSRSFRRTLLLRRDGARLHAGSLPGEGGRKRVSHKLAFLVASGLPEQDAATAMLAASRFTVGSVLEEQADLGADRADRSGHEADGIDHDSAFEAGLALIVAGLATRRS